jgi:hypothetical protein
MNNNLSCRSDLVRTVVLIFDSANLSTIKTILYMINY